MTWETVDGVFQIALDPLFTATAAAIFFVVGVAVKRYVAFLRRFCVPTALIGGWIAVFFTLSIRRYGVSVSFDPILQTPMILAFFATVGIGGRLSFLIRGGWALVIYLAGCWGVAIFQNTLGVGLAKLFDLHAILGVMAGAVSLKGGHETAAVFGAAAENLGVAGAQVVAIASATYGLVAGGLLGGPLISWLIEHNKLEPTSRDDTTRRRREEEAAVSMGDFDFFRMLTLVLVVMTTGKVVSAWINGQAKSAWQWGNFFLPDYVGTMFVGVIFRNANDVLKAVKLHSKAIELISKTATGIFLTMVAMSLRVWDLYGLMTPLAVILLLQTAVIEFLAVFVLFPILGRDYDAAIMCAGFIGHSLGATPNAISNMNAVCERWGALSYKAFLIVPLCSAVLIDLVSIPNIVWFINYFTR